MLEGGRVRWCDLLLTVAVCCSAPLLVSTAHGVEVTPETCPPSSIAATATPAAPPLTDLLHPPLRRVIACIAAQPIDGVTFRHWANVARKAEGPSHKRLNRRAVVSEVMGFLISSDWVIGEAKYLNIRLSATEVQHRFEHIRHQQFPRRREFKAFLKSSGQTVGDLLFRVRLNLLSSLIQRKIVAGASSPGDRERALAQFVTTFRETWTARTYCARAYAVSDCGHVQDVL
jgi:hypothetical protein